MDNCEHKWVFQETQQKTTVSGYEHYTAHYHRIDVCFCEKCCEIKKIEQKESVRYHLAEYTDFNNMRLYGISRRESEKHD